MANLGKMTTLKTVASNIAQICYDHGWDAQAVSGIWGEVVAGYDTYGHKGMLWIIGIRQNSDSEWFYSRVKARVRRSLRNRMAGPQPPPDQP